MSLHLEEYICSNCHRAFIPYQKGLACPHCGREETSEGNYYDFISLTKNVLTLNKEEYGRYRPPAWLVRSASDHVWGICFDLFEKIEKTKPQNIGLFIKETLEAIGHWESPSYGKHVTEIVMAMGDIYQKENGFRIKRSLFSRLFNWFDRKYQIKEIIREYLP